MAEFERIENVPDLASFARTLAAEPVVAIDTEADSFYHYFDKTCLVQIATAKRIFLVDPLSLGGPAQLAPLGPLFASKKVRKIFHAGEYDLFVLKRDCGFQFANLFDTMICAQLLGYPSVGLAALAERHFGVRLPKDEQRSDWSSRPLRESQLTYAAADVTHLIPLAERLESELHRASRWQWALEEFETLAHRQWPEREFDKLGYLRIKGARALDAEALAILRELYWMRDRRARQVDRPPFKILGNRTLIEIAQQAPENDADLAKIKGMTDLMLRRVARDVLGAVARGKKRRHGPLPRGEGSGRRRMDRPAERRLVALKRWRAERARELSLDPGVLCPNSALEAMVVRNPSRVEELRDVAGLKAWFVREFGREIVKELAAAPAEAPED